MLKLAAKYMSNEEIKKITGTKAALRLTFRKKKFMKIRNEEKRLGQFNTDRAY